MTDAERAEQVLQGLINALMETGVRERDIITALDRLSADAKRKDPTDLPRPAT
jgi:hypothetical protein